MKKILFVLPHIWYVENYIEYVIKYFSDTYYFDMGLADGELLSKNLDEYDLLIPLLGTHRHFPPEKYRHKTACIAWQPSERECDISMLVGATTPYVETSFPDMMPLRMGIDTNIFYPYPMIRDNELLRVGFVGKPHNPRRLFKEVILPLKDIDGVDLRIYVQEQLNQQDIDFCGGEEFRKRIHAVHRKWVGLPNIYNQLDVMVRIDCDMGYSFPCVESIACGTPIISSDSGIDKQLTDAGCGILITQDESDFRGWAYNHIDDLARKYRDAVITLRDDRKLLQEMKLNTQIEVKNWTWDKCIPLWDAFFTKCFERI